MLAAAVIGGAASLASSIIGAVGSANQNRKANALIDTQRTENRRWYDKQTSQDFMQRSDTQALLKKQKEILEEQYKKAQGVNTVAGGTDEALAMQKAAANASLSDTMTNIAGQSAAYKDSAEQQFRQQDAALAQQQAGAANNQAQQIAQAAGQGVSAGLNLMGTAIGQEKKITKSEN